MAHEPVATSARKAMTTEDRATMGLDALDSPERRSWESTLEEARSSGIPEKAQRIASEVNAKPRALSDTETAGLVVDATRLKNEHRELTEKIGKATDPGEVATLSAEVGRVADEFDSLSRALRVSGTEKGRALAAQKLTIDQDFNLLSLKSRAKAAKGADLSPKESAQIEGLTRKLDATNTRVAELEKQLTEQAAERAIRRHAAGRRGLTHQARTAEFSGLLAEAKALLKAGCR